MNNERHRAFLKAGYHENHVKKRLIRQQNGFHIKEKVTQHAVTLKWLSIGFVRFIRRKGL
jgi:hypothetical protein